MKRKNLKPLLKGGVLLLPALLLLAGDAKESKAMLRGALSKLTAGMSTRPKINLPSGNVKLKPFALPGAVKNLKVSAGKATSSKGSYGFANPNYVGGSGTTQNQIKRSNSDPTSERPKTLSSSLRPTTGISSTPSSPTLQRKSSLAPKVPPREPSSENFQKLDPQYDRVPKPIFTPRKPGDPIPEPEVYENVVQLHTSSGTLTLFKDKN